MARYLALMAVACASLALARAADAQPAQDGQRQKEIELLKREVELLKKENELLKRQIELLKKGDGNGAAPARGKMAVRGTLDGVTYEVTKTEMNGPLWQLTLTAISEEGDKAVFFTHARGITADGKTVALGNPTRPLLFMRQGTVRLPEGVKVQIRFRMGKVPGRIKEFARVEFLRGFGAKQVPLILKNVKVGP